MSIYAGKSSYKGFDIEFWYTPKTLKVLAWKPNSLTLIKKFFVRDGDYQSLRSRVVKWLDKYGDRRL
jgi:hypothetical protein